jgi:hypothetical protein
MLSGPEIKVHLADRFGGIPLISQGAGKGWRIFRQIDTKGTDTGVWILTGHNAAPIGHTGGVGHAGIGEHDSFAGQFVDIWGLQYLVARTSQVIGSLLISYKKYDVHISSCLLSEDIFFRSYLKNAYYTQWLRCDSI